MSWDLNVSLRDHSSISPCCIRKALPQWSLKLSSGKFVIFFLILHFFELLFLKNWTSAVCLTYPPSRMREPPLWCFPGGALCTTVQSLPCKRQKGLGFNRWVGKMPWRRAWPPIPLHSCVLAWRIPRTEEPGGLRFTGSQRDTRDWSNLACMHAPTFAFASWALINNKRRWSRKVWSKYHRESKMSEGSGEWLEPQGRRCFPRGAEQVGPRSWHRGWETLGPPGSCHGWRCSQHRPLALFCLFASFSLLRLSLLLSVGWLQCPLFLDGFKTWFSQEPTTTGTHLCFLSLNSNFPD